MRQVPSGLLPAAAPARMPRQVKRRPVHEPLRPAEADPRRRGDVMAETRITFKSEGLALAGAVRVPDGVEASERRPAFIVLHGFGSNMNAGNVLAPCAMFEKLGYVTMRFDM